MGSEEIVFKLKADFLKALRISLRHGLFHMSCGTLCFRIIRKNIGSSIYLPVEKSRRALMANSLSLSALR